MFVAMPPGWHVTSGPAAVYWGPDMSATGGFRLEMEVFLFDPQRRREAFGLFFGGQDLNGADQRYTYFLIRDGAQFIIKRRAGNRAPTIHEWTDHGAIHGYADRGEEEVSVKNVLAVEAAANTVRFLVNGIEVASLPRSQLRAGATISAALIELRSICRGPSSRLFSLRTGRSVRAHIHQSSRRCAPLAVAGLRFGRAPCEECACAPSVLALIVAPALSGQCRERAAAGPLARPRRSRPPSAPIPCRRPGRRRRRGSRRWGRSRIGRIPAGPWSRPRRS